MYNYLQLDADPYWKQRPRRENMIGKNDSKKRLAGDEDMKTMKNLKRNKTESTFIFSHNELK